MSTAARIDELRKKFEEHPRRYFAPLANEYRKAGELAQAIALCREHLPQQPGHMSGYIVFGQALFESGSLSEARSVFEQALALDPENFIALRHLGDIAKMNGDVSAARRWYERVLDADPRNDDIAAQLAALTPMPTPPMSSPPVPVFIGRAPERAIEPTSTPLLAAAFGAITGTAVSVPTPNAALRAVDFDVVNTRLTHQAPLDLDAIEQLDAGSTTSPREDAAAAPPLLPDVPEADDSFGFPQHEVVVDSAAADPMPAFDGEIITPVWPDTTDLVARVVSPRSSTPVDVPVTADVVAAFGREASDPVAEATEGETPDTLSEFDRADHARASSVPAASALVDDDAIRREGAWLDIDLSNEPQADVTSDAMDSRSAVEDSGTRSAELTWLVTPASNEALQWISANDGASDDEEPPVAQEITTVFAEALIVAAPLDPPLAPVGWSETESREETELTTEAPDLETQPETPAGPAFVTATMAELLVSQGYLTRAVEVYDELARRQPENLTLSARLFELQERLGSADRSTARTLTPRESFDAVAATAAPTYGTPVWVNSMIPSAEGGETEAALFLAAAGESRDARPSRTARETFARLAARRVANSTLSLADTPSALQADGLTALFGVPSDGADDTAARELADAFAPISAEFMDDGSLLDLDPSPPTMASAASDPSAVVASSASANDLNDAFAFDRFFPDPAVGAGDVAPAPRPASPATGDDLAEFAAWLKGLGAQ